LILYTLGFTHSNPELLVRPTKSPASRGRLTHFGAISRSPAASLKSPASLAVSNIVKIVSTRCHILRLKFAKFHFGWGSAPDPDGGAHSTLPDPWIDLRGPTSKHGVLKEGKGREGKGKTGVRGERRGKAGGERSGRKERGGMEHRRRSSVNCGRGKTFCPKICVGKVNKMPEFYMIIVQKIFF